MKKRYQLFLIVVLAAVFLVLGVWFQARRLLTASKVQEVLVQKIQALTEGTLRFQHLQVRYFPQPRIFLEQPQLTFSNDPLVVEAEQMGFDFDILPLLFGRTEPSAIYVTGGKGTLSLPPLFSFAGPVSLEDFSLKMGAIRPNVPIPVQFLTGLAGKPDAVSVKGYVTVASVEQWNWEKAGGHLLAELKEFSVGRSAQAPQGAPASPVIFKSGQVTASLEFGKKPGDLFLDLTAAGNVAGLGYEVMQENAWTTPPLLDTEWEVKGAWNNDTEELKLQKAKMKLPFVVLEADGSVKVGTGEITGLHLTGENMVLEDLLKYWPGFEGMLPFHIGFSGPSKWILSAEGTLDHLSLHWNWDLTGPLLTYGQYFSKAKDIPLSLNFDCLVQKGEALSGDFSVKFQDMSLKGNLSGLDLKTGEGQLNLITNKFALDGWEQYLPALQQYKVGGGIKFLGNWKGDLRKLEQAEQIFHLTLEKGSWTTAEGLGLKEATLSFDYSPLMFEGRQMQFHIGDSPVTVDLKITGETGKRQAEIQLTSGELKPGEAWRSIAALFQRKTEGTGTDLYGQVRDSIAAVFPGNETIKDLSTEVRYADQVWTISSLKFEGYEGQADLKGKVGFDEKTPYYKGEGEIRGLDFGRFLSRYDASQKVLEGSLALKGSFEGKGWGPEATDRSFFGQGDFNLTRATFRTFDLKEEIAKIRSFEGIEQAVPNMSDFDEVDLRWKLEEGKFITDNLLMKHKDYIVDGEGTVGLDGAANFRMEVFLSSALAAQVFPHIASSFHKEPKAHLGPVPILLSGSFSKPDLKSDPTQVAGLVDKISRKKTRDILVELVLE